MSQKLKLTDKNEGKFKVIETSNPTGYEGIFEKEITFDKATDYDTVQNITLQAENNQVKRTLYINKVDSVTREQIPGVVFKLYEMDYGEDSILKNEIGTLTYDPDTGMYKTPELTYTDANKGNFYIEEEVPIYGYDGSWSKEFNLSDYQDKQVITAENTKIQTRTITVKKIVQGSMGNRVKKFDFKLSMADSNGNYPEKLKAVFKDTEGNETTSILSAQDGTVTFSLADEEEVSFLEIPEGSTYTVTEDNEEEYEVTSENEAGTVTGDVTVTFTNTKNGEIPTSADTPIPYGLFIMAFAFLTILWIRRKTTR